MTDESRPLYPGDHQAKAAAGVNQNSPELLILKTKLVGGILKAARSEIAMQLHFDRPSPLIDALLREAGGVECGRRQIAGSVIDLSACVRDKRIEIRGPHKTA